MTATADQPAPGGDAVTETIAGGGSLNGVLRVPGDKSISHRALLMAALAEGPSTITGLSEGDDVRRTLEAVAALGAEVVRDGPVVTVTGGRSRLHAPEAALDLGNSGTGLRLLAGVAATVPGITTLTGDQSLRTRPMDRVAEPLIRMGARVDGGGDRCLPPITVTGGPLHGIEYEPPMASAQVKSAVLLAGLAAAGETVVHERVATRAHTEEMLAAAGADITSRDVGPGRVVRVRASALSNGAYVIPGDPSQAAFWVVGATVIPGSLVTVDAIHLGAERLGFIGVLRRMGATIEIEEEGGGSGSVTSYSCLLHGTDVEAEEIPSLDEVPILAVAAAVAHGTTRFHNVGELRVKESDRLAATVALVRAFGAFAEADGDDLIVRGEGAPLRPGRVDAGGDHRMAMAAAVAGAACPAPAQTTVTGWESVATSYPTFSEDLAGLRARTPGAAVNSAAADTRPLPVIAIDGPAGSGKSTVSRALAARLGVDRLDTGAMYRAVTWAVLDRDVEPADWEAVAEVARGLDIAIGERVTVDGTDVTETIRGAEVSGAVSLVAANPAVREVLVKRQRQWMAERGGGVVEGRDIGSVVFPDADVKIYLTAADHERARRRPEEGSDALSRRDRLDRTRTASPLGVADGARIIDTTDRSVEDIVEQVVTWL